MGFVAIQLSASNRDPRLSLFCWRWWVNSPSTGVMEAFILPSECPYNHYNIKWFEINNPTFYRGVSPLHCEQMDWTCFVYIQPWKSALFYFADWSDPATSVTIALQTSATMLSIRCQRCMVGGSSFSYRHSSLLVCARSFALTFWGYFRLSYGFTGYVQPSYSNDRTQISTVKV